MLFGIEDGEINEVFLMNFSQLVFVFSQIYFSIIQAKISILCYNLGQTKQYIFQLKASLIKTFQKHRNQQSSMSNKALAVSDEVELIKFDGELQSFWQYLNKVVYLTESELVVVDLELQLQTQTLPINGNAILLCSVGGHNTIAILYITGVIEIRKLNNLKQLVFIIQPVQYDIQTHSPLLKWQKHQLYCIYPNKLQIIDTVYKKRQVFTSVKDQGDHLVDVMCSSLMEGEKLIVLRYQSKMVFTIMPLTVTEMELSQPITESFIISHPKSFLKHKRQYMVIVENHKIMKVFDFMNLKQICEVDFGTQKDEELVFLRDPLNEHILVRKYLKTKDKYGNDTIEVKGHYLFVINKEIYYQKQRNARLEISEGHKFFKHCIELPFKQMSLFLISTHKQLIQHQAYTSIQMGYVQNNKLHLAWHVFPNKPTKQMLRPQLQEIPSVNSKQNSDWSSIISSYLEMSVQFSEALPAQCLQPISLPQQSEKMENQVSQINRIRQDLQELSIKFHQELYKKCLEENILFRNQDQQQEFIQKEWTLFFRRYLKENRFDMGQEYFVEVEFDKRGWMQGQKNKGYSKNIQHDKLAYEHVHNNPFYETKHDTKLSLNNDSNTDVMEEIEQATQNPQHSTDQRQLSFEQLIRRQLNSLDIIKSGVWLNQKTNLKSQKHPPRKPTLDQLTKIEREKLQKQKLQLNLNSQTLNPFESIQNEKSKICVETYNDFQTKSNENFQAQWKDERDKFIQNMINKRMFASQQNKNAQKIQSNMKGSLFLDEPQNSFELRQSFSSKKQTSQQPHYLDKYYSASLPEHHQPNPFSPTNDPSGLQSQFPMLPQMPTTVTTDSLQQLLPEQLQYQQFVKNFIMGLHDSEQKQRLQRQSKYKLEEQKKKHRTFTDELLKKVQDQAISLDQLNYEIYINRLPNDMAEELKLKVLEMRFRNVTLGRCLPPDPEEIERILGSANIDSKDHSKKKNELITEKKETNQKKKEPKSNSKPKQSEQIWFQSLLPPGLSQATKQLLFQSEQDRLNFIDIQSIGQKDAQIQHQRHLLRLKIQSLNREEEQKHRLLQKRLQKKKYQLNHYGYGLSLDNSMPKIRYYARERAQAIAKIIEKQSQYVYLVDEPFASQITRNLPRFHNGFFSTLLENIEKYPQNYKQTMKQDPFYKNQYRYFEYLFETIKQKYQEEKLAELAMFDKLRKSFKKNSRKKGIFYESQLKNSEQAIKMVHKYVEDSYHLMCRGKPAQRLAQNWIHVEKNQFEPKKQMVNDYKNQQKLLYKQWIKDFNNGKYFGQQLNDFRFRSELFGLDALKMKIGDQEKVDEEKKRKKKNKKNKKKKKQQSTEIKIEMEKGNGNNQRPNTQSKDYQKNDSGSEEIQEIQKSYEKQSIDSYLKRIEQAAKKTVNKANQIKKELKNQEISHLEDKSESLVIGAMLEQFLLKNVIASDDGIEDNSKQFQTQKIKENNPKHETFDGKVQQKKQSKPTQVKQEFKVINSQVQNFQKTEQSTLNKSESPKKIIEQVKKDPKIDQGKKTKKPPKKPEQPNYIQPKKIPQQKPYSEQLKQRPLIDTSTKKISNKFKSKYPQIEQKLPSVWRLLEETFVFPPSDDAELDEQYYEAFFRGLFRTLGVDQQIFMKKEYKDEANMNMVQNRMRQVDLENKKQGTLKQEQEVDQCKNIVQKENLNSEPKFNQLSHQREQFQNDTADKSIDKRQNNQTSTHLQSSVFQTESADKKQLEYPQRPTSNQKIQQLKTSETQIWNPIQQNNQAFQQQANQDIKKLQNTIVSEQPKRQFIQLNQNIIELIYDVQADDQVIQKMKKEIQENIQRQIQRKNKFDNNIQVSEKVELSEQKVENSEEIKTQTKQTNFQNNKSTSHKEPIVQKLQIQKPPKVQSSLSNQSPQRRNKRRGGKNNKKKNKKIIYTEKISDNLQNSGQVTKQQEKQALDQVRQQEKHQNELQERPNIAENLKVMTEFSSKTIDFAQEQQPQANQIPPELTSQHTLQTESKSEVIFTHQPQFDAVSSTNPIESSKEQKSGEFFKNQSEHMTNEQGNSLKQSEAEQENLPILLNKNSSQSSIYPNSSQNQDFIEETIENEEMKNNEKQLLQYLTVECQELFKPVEQGFNRVASKLQSIQETCSKTLSKFQEFLEISSPHTMENYIKRYFVEMTSQVTQQINIGYQHFEQKIQSLEQQSQNNFTSVCESYQKYFDHQVKHRLEIFARNRATVEEQLAALREEFRQEEQIDQEEEERFMRMFGQKGEFSEEEIRLMEERLFKKGTLFFGEDEAKYLSQRQKNQPQKKFETELKKNTKS